MIRKHWIDKPFLRDLFWFIVLPHRLKQWMESRATHHPAVNERFNHSITDQQKLD